MNMSCEEKYTGDVKKMGVKLIEILRTKNSRDVIEKIK